MDPIFAYKIHTERKEIERLLEENKLEHDKRSKELDQLIIRYLNKRKNKTK